MAPLTTKWQSVKIYESFQCCNKRIMDLAPYPPHSYKNGLTLGLFTVGWLICSELSPLLGEGDGVLDKPQASHPSPSHSLHLV